MGDRPTLQRRAEIVSAMAYMDPRESAIIEELLDALEPETPSPAPLADVEYHLQAPTLETADERREWWATVRAMIAAGGGHDLEKTADAFVRAYRERLPGESTPTRRGRPDPTAEVASEIRRRFDVDGETVSELVEWSCWPRAEVVEALGERLPLVSTPLGDLDPGIAAGIGDAMGELIDADREERASNVVMRHTDETGTWVELGPDDGDHGVFVTIARASDDEDDERVATLPFSKLREFVCGRGPTEGAAQAALAAIVDHGYSSVQYSSPAELVHVMDWMVDTASAGLGGRPVPELTDGPTEGASVAGISEDHVKMATARVFDFAVSHGMASNESIRGMLAWLIREPQDLSASERPPTGGASPEPDETPPHGWELCEVGTPADSWYCREAADDDGVFRGKTTEVWRTKIDAVAEARDLAAVDAETFDSRALGRGHDRSAMDDSNDKRAVEAGWVPNVPDAPGWWLYSEEPKHVVERSGGLYAWSLDERHDAMRLVAVDQLNSAWWGGRCLRGAPRARDEARDLLAALDGAVEAALGWTRVQMVKDESWSRIVDGLTVRLRAALDAAKAKP